MLETTELQEYLDAAGARVFVLNVLSVGFSGSDLVLLVTLGQERNVKGQVITGSISCIGVQDYRLNQRFGPDLMRDVSSFSGGLWLRDNPWSQGHPGMELRIRRLAPESSSDVSMLELSFTESRIVAHGFRMADLTRDALCHQLVGRRDLPPALETDEGRLGRAERAVRMIERLRSLLPDTTDVVLFESWQRVVDFTWLSLVPYWWYGDRFSRERFPEALEEAHRRLSAIGRPSSLVPMPEPDLNPGEDPASKWSVPTRWWDSDRENLLNCLQRRLEPGTHPSPQQLWEVAGWILDCSSHLNNGSGPVLEEFQRLVRARFPSWRPIPLQLRMSDLQVSEPVDGVCPQPYDLRNLLQARANVRLYKVWHVPLLEGLVVRGLLGICPAGGRERITGAFIRCHNMTSYEFLSADPRTSGATMPIQLLELPEDSADPPAENLAAERKPIPVRSPRPRFELCWDRSRVIAEAFEIVEQPMSTHLPAGYVGPPTWSRML